MSMAQAKNIGLCPDCGEEVRFKKFPFVGQSVACRRCATQLLVVRKAPVVFRLAADIWEDEEDEDIEKHEPSQVNQRHKRAWR